MIGFFRFNQIMYVLFSLFLMGVSINILLFKAFGIPMILPIEPTYLKLWMCLALSLLSMWCSAYWEKRIETQYVGRIAFLYGNNIETLSHILAAIDKRIYYPDKISHDKIQIEPIYKHGLKITAMGRDLYVEHWDSESHWQYVNQITHYFYNLESRNLKIEAFAKRNFTEKK